MIIEIVNWKKFNPRTDVKASSWFRFEHTMMFDPFWDDLQAEDFAVFLFLMSYASMKNDPRLELSLESIARHSRVSEETATEALKILETKGAVRVEHVPVTRPLRARTANVSLRTNERTDGRNVTDDTNEREQGRARPAPRATTPSGTAQIKDLFLEEYLKRHGHPYPNWGKSENGKVSNWLKSVSLDHAKELVPLFMQWTDPYVVKAGHPLGLLIAQHVRLWTDHVRLGQKALTIDSHNRAAKEVTENARNVGFAVRFADRQRSFGGDKSLPDQTQAGVPRVNGDPFDGEEAFALSGPENV